MILTTTGTAATVEIGTETGHPITLTHPETYDLLGPDSIFDAEDIAGSQGSINAAIAAGTITAETQDGEAVLMIPGLATSVLQVNNKTGAVLELTADDIPDGVNNQWVDPDHTHGELHTPNGAVAPIRVTGGEQVLISSDQLYQLNIQNPTMDPAKGTAILMRGTNAAGTAFDFTSLGNVNQKAVLASTANPSAGTAHIAVANDGTVDFAGYTSARDDGLVDRERMAFFDAAGAVKVGALRVKRMIHHSSRLYCYTDLRWVYSNINYGQVSYHQTNQTAGVGAIPNTDWFASGYPLRAGTKINRMFFAGYANNLTVENIQCVFRVHENDFFAPGLAIDNDADVVPVDLIPPTTIFNYTAGNLADYRMAEIDLGGYVMQNDSQLIHYFKPIGTITATRYFRAAYAIEIEEPA